MTTTKNHITPLTPEWHEARKKRITGTDVSAVLGCSPHKTALSVWARLTGKAETTFEETSFSRWGLATESANRELLASEAGLEVTDSPGFVIDSEYDWLGATPDGLIGRIGEPSAPLGAWEGKSPSIYTADDWQDEDAPLHYQVQQQAQMRVTGLGWGVLSALIPPRKADDSPLWWREIEANERFQAAMMEQLVEFWENHVQRDIPPAATGSKLDAAVLKELHPKDNGSVVVLDGTMGALVFQLDKAKAEIKRQEKVRADLENVLKQSMGDATYAVVPDGPCFSWKTQVQHRKASEAREIEMRVLRQIKQLPKGVEVTL